MCRHHLPRKLILFIDLEQNTVAQQMRVRRPAASSEEQLRGPTVPSPVAEQVSFFMNSPSQQSTSETKANFTIYVQIRNQPR